MHVTQYNVIPGIFPHPPDGGKSHPVNFATPPSPENQNTPPTGVHSSENQKTKCEIFFACGELSSILLFNFVQNVINCMRAIATKSVKKIFACGELLSILLFNFVQNFSNCMRAIATKYAKKISPAASFHRFCFSISFKISLIVCVRLRQSL